MFSAAYAVMLIAPELQNHHPLYGASSAMNTAIFYSATALRQVMISGQTSPPSSPLLLHAPLDLRLIHVTLFTAFDARWRRSVIVQQKQFLYAFVQLIHASAETATNQRIFQITQLRIKLFRPIEQEYVTRLTAPPESAYFTRPRDLAQQSAARLLLPLWWQFISSIYRGRSFSTAGLARRHHACQFQAGGIW